MQSVSSNPPPPSVPVIATNDTEIPKVARDPNDTGEWIDLTLPELEED